MAVSYAIWHGPEALKAIARRVHSLAGRLATGLKSAGIAVEGERRFDTVTAMVKGEAERIAAAAEKGSSFYAVSFKKIGYTRSAHLI